MDKYKIILNPRAYKDIDDIFAYIHADDEKVIDEAKERLIGAYTLSDEPVEAEQIVKGIIL